MTEDIAQALRAAFGNADMALEPLAGGASGAELFAFAAGGRDYVLRKTGRVLARDPNRVARATACMRIAADLGVAPELVYADDAIAIMRRIHGEPITRATPREGDPLGRLAATLRRLHRRAAVSRRTDARGQHPRSRRRHAQPRRGAAGARHPRDRGERTVRDRRCAVPP